MSNIKYLQRDKFFESFLKKLKADKENFNTESTNYTDKLYSQYGTILFNQDGLPNNEQLILINKIRAHNKADADLTGQKLKSIRSADYFKLFHFDKNLTVDAYKVDFSQAYWKLALNENVITPEIDDYFESIVIKRLPKQSLFSYNEYAREKKKKIRLVGLGSLATTKTFKFYENGEQNDDLTKLVTEPTKHIYMNIHVGLDDIMKALSLHFDCFYYYVDCFFAKDKRIVDAIRDLGFNCTVEKTRIKAETFFNSILIADLITGKRYNVRKEDFGNIANLGQI